METCWAPWHRLTSWQDKGTLPHFVTGGKPEHFRNIMLTVILLHIISSQLSGRIFPERGQSLFPPPPFKLIPCAVNILFAQLDGFRHITAKCAFLFNHKSILPFAQPEIAAIISYKLNMFSMEVERIHIPIMIRLIKFCTSRHIQRSYGYLIVWLH